MKKRAFTLAEMMVVMLILTIILAAFAPMMTKRRMGGSPDSPWKWAVNNIDAYFGLNSNQTAMLGQKEKADSDPNVKLLINSPSGAPLAIKTDTVTVSLITANNGLKLTAPYYNGTMASSGTAFGIGALPQSDSNNTAFGFNALAHLSSGKNNVAIGSNALIGLTDGDGNVAVGDGTFMPDVNMYNSYNTIVGYGACASMTTSKPVTCIGAFSGPNTTTSSFYSGGTVYLGNKLDEVDIQGTLEVKGQQITPSDRRLKNVKAEYSKGLEELRLIQPYNYTFKSDKKERVGVIAQDLQSVLPEAVSKNDDGYLSIKQENIFYTLLNSVKQLDKLVQGLIGEVKMILTRLQTHDEEIQKLKKENQELRERLEKLEKAMS